MGVFNWLIFFFCTVFFLPSVIAIEVIVDEVIEAECPSGYEEKGAFMTNDNASARYCVKSEEFVSGNEYVSTSTLRQAASCESGEQASGLFLGFGDESTVLCVFKESSSSESGLLSDAALAEDICPSGFEQLGGLVDMQGATWYHCLMRVGESVQEQPSARGAPSVARRVEPVDSSEQSDSQDSSENMGVCNDGDNGKNIDIRSYVESSADSRMRDSCNGKKTVIEWYCDENNHAIGDHIECSQGKICEDGRCISKGFLARLFHNPNPSSQSSSGSIQGTILSPSLAGSVSTYLRGERCTIARTNCRARNPGLASNLEAGFSDVAFQIKLLDYLYPRNPGMAKNVLTELVTQQGTIAEDLGDEGVSYLQPRNSGMASNLGSKRQNGRYVLDAEFQVSLVDYLWSKPSSRVFSRFQNSRNPGMAKNVYRQLKRTAIPAQDPPAAGSVATGRSQSARVQDSDSDGEEPSENAQSATGRTQSARGSVTCTDSDSNVVNIASKDSLYTHGTASTSNGESLSDECLRLGVNVRERFCGSDGELKTAIKTCTEGWCDSEKNTCVRRASSARTPSGRSRSCLGFSFGGMCSGCIRMGRSSLETGTARCENEGLICKAVRAGSCDDRAGLFGDQSTVLCCPQ